MQVQANRDARVTLINDYPRFMGHPFQDLVVYNQQQRDEYIQYWIRRCPVYISVYKFLYVDRETGQPDRKSAWIDKIFLDFDDENWLENILALHRWCEEREIIHRAHFSGRGGHFFIFTDPRVKFKSSAVRNCQMWLKQNIAPNLDARGCASTSRIFRYPNSWNFKGRRYCIPISNRILNENLTIDILRELARKQRFVDSWFGTNLLSLKRWDIAELMYEEDQTIEFDLVDINPNVAIDFPGFPPCVQSWMSTPDLDDYGKFLLVLFLKDQILIDDTFSTQEIISILKKCLSAGEFDHYFGNGKGNLPRRHYGHRGTKFRKTMERSYYMPACRTIKMKGYCPGDCGRSHPIYS